MNFYEHVFIVRPEVSAQRAESLAEEFSSVVTQGESEGESAGKCSKTEYWGLKQLAYPIKKNQKGHYLLMNLTATPDQITEMERQMKLHDDVLRYLTLRVEKHDPNPSIQMRNKDKDDDDESPARREDRRDDRREDRRDDRRDDSPARREEAHA